MYTLSDQTHQVKPSGSYKVNIEVGQLKISLHSPMGQLMLIKNDQRTMFFRCILTESVLQCKVCENAYVSPFLTLRCNNSVRNHQIIMVL